MNPWEVKGQTKPEPIYVDKAGKESGTQAQGSTLKGVRYTVTYANGRMVTYFRPAGAPPDGSQDQEEEFATNTDIEKQWNEANKPDKATAQTVKVGGRVKQLNRDTGQYDIDLGPEDAPAERKDISVTQSGGTKTTTETVGGNVTGTRTEPVDPPRPTITELNDGSLVAISPDGKTITQLVAPTDAAYKDHNINGSLIRVHKDGRVEKMYSEPEKPAKPTVTTNPATGGLISVKEDPSDPSGVRATPIAGTEKPKDTAPFPSFDEQDIRLGQLGKGLVNKLRTVYNDPNLTAEQKTSRAEQLIGAARIIESELRGTVQTQAGIFRDDTDVYKSQIQETQSRRALGMNSATYALDFLKNFGPTANDGQLLGKAFLGMALLPMKLAQATGGMATPQAPVKGPALQQAGSMSLPNEPKPQTSASPVNITFNGMGGGPPGFGWAGGGGMAPPAAEMPARAGVIPAPTMPAVDDEEPAPQGFLGGWA